MVQIENIPFDPPGGEGNEVSTSRPINLAMLNRQTLGDRELELEILSMFSHQSGELADLLKNAAGDERKRVAHKLKGAARSVGALSVAEEAAAIEGDPSDTRALGRLIDNVAEVRDYISSICR
jgi:HPt (histidine-containing phosphotransfer) domain-containing protein